MKLLFWLVFLIKLIICLKKEDYCRRFDINNKLLACQNKHNYNCGHGLCSVDRSSCQNLAIFYLIKKYEIEGYSIYKYKQVSFLNSIKDCNEVANYKWNSNDVCSNSKDCKHPPSHRLWLWSNKMNQNECKCSGKYNYRCNSDYCALYKEACNGLNTTPFEIKKCKLQ